MTDLPAVIAQVESRNNPQRLRFEAGLYDSWGQNLTPARETITSTIARVHDCSVLTAEMIACTSWGRYQILGENLYDICRLTITVFAYTTSPAVELRCFNSFLGARKIAFTYADILADEAKRTAFISAYNGPGAIDAYWARMQQAAILLASNASA